MDRASDMKMHCWSPKQVDEYQIENYRQAGDGFGLRLKLPTHKCEIRLKVLRYLDMVLHIAPSPNSDLYIKCKRIDDLTASDMTNTELETSVETENDTSLQMGGEQHQCQKQEEQEKIFTDIEHEIECPRCFDTMTLRSDFDNLYYSCEECGFILYTIKRNL